MSRYVEKENRDQIGMSLCLDDMIGKDNPVRLIEMIVESMNIAELGFIYSEPKAMGRKPYNPTDMFKLYVYSYFNGIHSSRKIEQECHRNIEVMWLIGELKPNHKTIAKFTKENKAAIKAAVQRFALRCDELNLASKATAAIDVRKFRAQRLHKI